MAQTKPGEFAGDGGHDLLLELAAADKARVAGVQPDLRRPGDLFTSSQVFFCRRCSSPRTLWVDVNCFGLPSG